jgi:hypothetical protein
MTFSIKTFSITIKNATTSIMTHCCDVILSVVYESFVLSIVVMLSVVNELLILSVVFVLNVVMLSIINEPLILSVVVILNVVILSVVNMLVCRVS